jgi:hypothetical protein
MNFHLNLLKPIFLFFMFTILIFFYKQNDTIKSIHRNRIQWLTSIEKKDVLKFYNNYEFMLNNNVLQ